MVGETAKRKRIDAVEVKRRAPIKVVVEAFCPGIQLKKQGREYVALSPFKDERTPSFAINPHKATFYCFATSQGGDAIRFVQTLLRVEFREAAEAIATRCLSGAVPEAPAGAPFKAAKAIPLDPDEDARDAEERARKLRRARAIWLETAEAPGTLVETYLRARGVDIDALARLYGVGVPRSLRFHAALDYRNAGVAHRGPAMVGSVRDNAGRFLGVHRTWLAADGFGKADLPKAKLALGAVFGGFGRLTDAAEEALLGEGYETTLVPLSALARQGKKMFAASGLSLGNLAGAGIGEGRAHPARRGVRLPPETPDPARPGVLLPEGVRRVTILFDNDGKDPAATYAQCVRAAAKFRQRGARAFIAAPESGRDFAEMAA